MTTLFQAPDEDARSLAASLIQNARFAALGVIDPATAAPMVSRIAFGTAPDGTPLSLISDLSHHSRALKENPACSLLVGEPGPKGDPLTHPRLTLQCTATFLRQGAAGHTEMRDHYLITHPKSQLYIDFTDFAFALFTVQAAHLNGGFGKAYTLTKADLIGA
ncbi:pyridoxamine 5'-phosphate oxidase family protein [Alphaproteobacteria bacterium KMM 3653]|uniref:Pyridoxamine 5'-phosphate oxidase family protein n=1 Tax=Harenicola maris TaxID=2841044 RepID=A0AAP2CMQ3_9RHOB|nr:pyridoxamine 5'-phosphate oxidase family protein [Harenicola maris]